ncbi:uncharacterized protein LOC133785262 [Humulus lupulus]|uniref:uncharacterized protein LOC133785262 n=1 Tax=Humulus lupulus TaxID=3486 RepID=UPI002B40A49F|nr:uncharacterized protein LOC133785262 [Humulus lupulus]
MPTWKMYVGKEDPVSCMNNFEVQTCLQGIRYDVQCRIFPTTLVDAAQQWFFKLEHATINSWDPFVRFFYSQFFVARTFPAELNVLVDIKQRPNEPLKDYVQQFMQEAAHSKIVSDDDEFIKLEEAIRKANRANQARTSTAPVKNTVRSETKIPKVAINQNSGKQNKNSNSGNNNDNKQEKANDKPREYVPRFTTYSTLLESQAYIFQAMQAEVPYRKPTPIKKDISKRDTNKLCKFHNNYRHDTNECNQLKDEIEFLIHSNHQAMRRYVRQSLDQQPATAVSNDALTQQLLHALVAG